MSGVLRPLATVSIYPASLTHQTVFFLPEMTDFSSLMAIIIRETEQCSPAAELSPMIFNK